jgi:hypothetical protein
MSSNPEILAEMTRAKKLTPITNDSYINSQTIVKLLFELQRIYKIERLLIFD